MSMNANAKRVINGTFGKLYFEGRLLAHVYKFQMKDNYTREKVQFCGSLRAGHKLTNIEGTGSIGMYKVDSMLAMEYGERVRRGDDPELTLMGSLEDPDSYGRECVAATGAQFDDLTIMDWEAGVLGKVECPFTFADYEFIDSIGGN